MAKIVIFDIPPQRKLPRSWVFWPFLLSASVKIFPLQNLGEKAGTSFWIIGSLTLTLRRGLLSD